MAGKFQSIRSLSGPSFVTRNSEESSEVLKIQDSGRRNGTSKSARNGTFGGTDVRLSQNSTGSTGSVSSTPSSTQSSIGTSRRKRIEVSDDEDDPFWD